MKFKTNSAVTQILSKLDESVVPHELLLRLALRWRWKTKTTLGNRNFHLLIKKTTNIPTQLRNRIMSKINRRTFVGQSLAAAGAVTLASGASRHVAANDKIGIAVVGAGGRGGSHIGAWLKDSRTEILYVVDVDEVAGNKRCDAIAEEQSNRPIFVTDMRAAFDDKSVNAVSTATPNHWHALCGVWAMQAGKDAYIEKPICHNIAEGIALVAAARKYKRMCQVGTQCRRKPAIQDAVKFIADGGIGDVKFARGLCYKRRKSIGAIGRLPDSRRKSTSTCGAARHHTPIRNSRASDSTTIGTGSGTTATATLGNQGPHQTDIARWGLGIDAHPHERDHLRRTARLPGRTQGRQLRRRRRHGQHRSVDL